MLDQNTDRMWYVIGAVLVGAAIILIANGAFPQMFASVGETFDDVIGNVKFDFDGNTEGIDDEEIDALIKKGYIPIATADELNNVRNTSPRTYGKGTDWEEEYTGGLDKKYVQVANINLSGYSKEEGWTPIGTNSSSFTGTYDGGNYVIRGLEVKGESKNYQGLFGFTEEATISNVGLIDNKVTGYTQVGGLVGNATKNSTISNSYATGSVTGTGNNVGGLVGATWKSSIKNSYATGSVKSSKATVGGLVGYATMNTTISNSYATGEVTGPGNVGGLVGAASESKINISYATGEVLGSGGYVGGLVGHAYTSSIIENSYATGSVKGTGTGTVEIKSRVGGLVGQANGSTKISNSYATGSVEATGSDEGAGLSVGGLVGAVAGTGNTVTNSYWDTKTTNQSTSAGGTGKTSEQMKQQTTYTDWDFDTVWKIDEGVSYPKLR